MYMYFVAQLIEHMKVNPYSLLVDGSNDTGIEKLNPLTVKIYDNTKRQVTTQLLDMCTTSGRTCGTADAIFSKINSVLSNYQIPWDNCIGFGVDNTSVNVGMRNSIMTRVKEKNSSCYFMGCPCHLIHNIACHASVALQSTSGFDVEDLCIDTFYWFDSSTKRKGILAEFCTFCDSDYREIVRHVGVRWLSLERAVGRILQLYESLQSYFQSEEQLQARFKRLQSAFNNPMTEVYLLFYQSILPTFTQINLLLQQEFPNIFLVADGIRSFLKKIFSKFISVQAIKAVNCITKVSFECVDNQLEDSSIFVGLITRQKLRRLLNEGDISPRDEIKFYSSVRAFFVDAASQALKKLPFSDDVLNNARFLNFEKREEYSFSAVEFFCNSYDNFLNCTPSSMSKLQEEFIEYQLLEQSDIPDWVWREALVNVTETDDGDEQSVQRYRMDMVWGYISTMRNAADHSLQFEQLSKIAKLVLTIPHSNAGEERVFSLIKQNKTSTRSSLNNNGTLQSIIQLKLANNDTCIKWKPTKPLLSACKKATMEYTVCAIKKCTYPDPVRTGSALDTDLILFFFFFFFSRHGINQLFKKENDTRMISDNHGRGI